MDDGPVEPRLAYALLELGMLDHKKLPMLAAGWLAAGYDGPDLREVAGVTHGEISDLRREDWLRALAEAGVVAAEVEVLRTAMPYLAGRVLVGELTEGDLVLALRSPGGLHWGC